MDKPRRNIVFTALNKPATLFGMKRNQVYGVFVASYLFFLFFRDFYLAALLAVLALVELKIITRNDIDRIDLVTSTWGLPVRLDPAQVPSIHQVARKV